MSPHTVGILTVNVHHLTVVSLHSLLTQMVITNYHPYKSQNTLLTII